MEVRYINIPDKDLTKSGIQLKHTEIFLTKTDRSSNVIELLNLGIELDVAEKEYEEKKKKIEFDLESGKISHNEYYRQNDLIFKKYGKLRDEYEDLLNKFSIQHKKEILDYFKSQVKSQSKPIYSDKIEDLAEACDSWIGLEHTSNSIGLILSHPFSKNLNNYDSKDIYRSVFISEEKFNKYGKVRVKPQKEKFIAYSGRDDWASGQTREDFDYSGDILTFKKEFQRENCILNFTELLNKIRNEGGHVTQIDEQELWMKSIPYYLNCVKSELIDVDKGEN